MLIFGPICAPNCLTWQILHAWTQNHPQNVGMCCVLAYPFNSYRKIWVIKIIGLNPPSTIGQGKNKINIKTGCTAQFQNYFVSLIQSSRLRSLVVGGVVSPSNIKSAAHAQQIWNCAPAQSGPPRVCSAKQPVERSVGQLVVHFPSIW